MPNVTNNTDLNDLAPEEIKDTARYILQNWKLAILTTESLHMSALKKTREQIQRVEGVNMERVYGTFVNGRHMGTNAIVRSGNGERLYYTRVYSAGHGVCNCPDFNFRNRYCKHLVRLSICILDENPRGEIYAN